MLPLGNPSVSDFIGEEMQTIVRQKLTEAGVLGVILMVIGPVMAGFSWLSIAFARQVYAGMPDVTWLYFVAAAGGILTLLSLPPVIVGRRYVIEGAAQ